MSDQWNEIKITVPAEQADTAAAITNMTVPYGIYIEDYSALEQETLEIAHIDLIDQELLQKDRTKAVIHVYINPCENPHEAVSFIEARLQAEGIAYSVSVGTCVQEDWINNWKQYFHPMPVGNRLLIRPLWIDDYDAQGRKVLNIEPGLAFGTGSHPTTRLCLETMEEYVKGGEAVLDIGCGSGILSIAALLLGAKSACGVDIDPLAVKTALQNAAENGFEPPQFTALEGDLSERVTGQYDVIFANIVADIVMRLNTQVTPFLKDGGVYITGGIIDSREPEVLASFAENGFTVLERREADGWLVFVCQKEKKQEQN